MKYRKKPVEIEAIKYDGENRKKIEQFVGKSLVMYLSDSSIMIPTLEGGHIATVDDWIIKGVKGEFYPCKPDIFRMTYDIVK